MQSGGGDLTGGETAFLIVCGAFWLGLFVWLYSPRMQRTEDGRSIPALSPEFKPDPSSSPKTVSGLSMVLFYFWCMIEPALTYFALLRTRKNSERIARFLREAKDLGMRRKPVDKLLPGRTGSDGTTGKGGIPR